jgi:hypothetical protein
MKKIAKRTQKMNGEFGITRFNQRRKGLNKILTILARGTRVSADPRAVDYTAAQFNL